MAKSSVLRHPSSNLEPLVLYFTAEVMDDKNKASVDILTYIRHPMTKPLLLFME